MKQTPKKIVYKRKYVERQVKRVGIGLLGTSQLLLSLLLGSALLWLVVSLVKNIPMIVRGIESSDTSLTDIFFFTVYLIGGSLGLGACFLFRGGTKKITQAVRINAEIVFDHTNTGDLPATESLVRASEQPVTPQQDVLLRPVGEMQDRHAEQLLRPS